MRIYNTELELESFAAEKSQFPLEAVVFRGAVVDLSHLDRMTDSTGLIQHAIYGIPRRESGYATDDNARALRLCVRLWNEQPDRRMLARVTTYLSFLEHARGPESGFHNFLSYQREWLDAAGTGDCQGQAVLALADVLASSLPEGYRALARELIENVLPTLAEQKSLRAAAYVVLAWERLRSAGITGMEPFEHVAFLAAQELWESYRRSAKPDWAWFESRLTYANAVLPHALFAAASCWPGEPFLSAAAESFSFLGQVTRANDVFWPVGNRDWHCYGEVKSLYDQQPVEAATMADAALAAFEATCCEKHLVTFRKAYDWFHGENSLGLALADRESGGCCDGLHPSGVNANQGAESTLAWLSTELKNSELGRACAEPLLDADENE